MKLTVITLTKINSAKRCAFAHKGDGVDNIYVPFGGSKMVINTRGESRFGSYLVNMIKVGDELVALLESGPEGRGPKAVSWAPRNKWKTPIILPDPAKSTPAVKATELGEKIEVKDDRMLRLTKLKPAKGENPQPYLGKVKGLVEYLAKLGKYPEGVKLEVRLTNSAWVKASHASILVLMSEHLRQQEEKTAAA